MQIMQTKEVTKMLGINRERIKYLKKQGVFVPEKAITDSKNAEYTERDAAALRKLVVLTKSGLTCGDIKKVQDGEWTLQEALTIRSILKFILWRIVMRKTNEEKGLLAKLASGILDGMVGNEKTYSGYKDVYCGKYIKDGEPVSYREGESSRFFNGKENERVPGKRTEEHYDNDERKLEFLQRYGWLTDDEDAKAYSAKFKPKK